MEPSTAALISIPQGEGSSVSSLSTPLSSHVRDDTDPGTPDAPQNLGARQQLHGKRCFADNYLKVHWSSSGSP